MTVRHHIVTMLILFVFQSSHVLIAQKNFQEGFIIDQKGDKINGFIDFREWDRNPKNITFKKGLNASEEKISPLQIKAFSVEEEYYLGVKLSVDRSPMNIKYMSYSQDSILETRHAFLRVLIEGEKSLYFLKDEDAKAHFYIKIDDHYEELVFRKQLKKVDGKPMVETINQYRSQLIDYLGACNEVKPRIENIKYETNTLISLFKKYYNCIGHKATYVGKKDKVEWHPVITGGMTATSINFKGGSQNDIINAEFNYSKNYSFGLGLNVIFPRDRKRWSFYNDLLIKSFQYDTKVEEIFNEHRYNYHFISLEATYISMSSLIRYQMRTVGLRPFINVGVYNAIARNIKSNKVTEYHFFDSFNTLEREALQSYRNYELGYVLGAGLGFGKFHTEIRYVGSNGMSANSIITTFFLLAGFTF